MPVVREAISRVELKSIKAKINVEAAAVIVIVVVGLTR